MQICVDTSWNKLIYFSSSSNSLHILFVNFSYCIFLGGCIFSFLVDLQLPKLYITFVKQQCMANAKKNICLNKLQFVRKKECSKIFDN